MQNANGEQKSPRQQEAPQALREAGKDVREPRCHAK